MGIAWRTLATLAVASAALAGCGDDDKPIREQSCSELADTYDDIREKIQPESSDDERQEGSQDAGELVERVDDLGGCPSEPSLQ